MFTLRTCSWLDGSYKLRKVSVTCCFFHSLPYHAISAFEIVLLCRPDLISHSSWVLMSLNTTTGALQCLLNEQRLPRFKEKAEFGLESLYASDSHSLSYVSLFCASLSKASVSLVQSRHLYESTLFTSSSWLTTIMADLLFLWQSTTSAWVLLILSFRWLSFSLKMIHLIILVNNFHSTKEYI